MCVFGLDLCTRFASVGFFFLFIAIFLVFGWFATDTEQHVEEVGRHGGVEEVVDFVAPTGRSTGVAGEPQHLLDGVAQRVRVRQCRQLRPRQRVHVSVGAVVNQNATRPAQGQYPCVLLCLLLLDESL